MHVLTITYLVVNLTTLAVLCALKNNAALSNSDTLTHSAIVSGAAGLMYLYTRRFLAGKKSGRVRLRISSAITLFATIITSILPNNFPLWVKIEQVVAGLLIAGVVVMLHFNTMQTPLLANDEEVTK